MGAMMQPEPAREHLTRAAESDPPSVAAVEALAELELLEKRPTEAIRHLDRGLSVFAGHRRLLALRGRAWAAQGEHDRAREDYEAALAIDPSEQDAQIALGLSLFRLGKGEAARAAMGAALRVDPTDPVAGAFADASLIEAL
jgi:tetratricopeptide (TPR) repeat protein